MKFLTLLFLIVFSSPVCSQVREEGKLLILIDSDMVATTYSDGKLLPITGLRDQLIKIDLNSDRRSVLNIPNSVTSWTKSMDITRDGNYLIISSVRGSMPQGTKEVTSVFDLPALQNIYMVDVNTLKVLDEIKAGNLPGSVSVNPQFELIGTTIDERGSEIGIIKFHPEELQSIQKFSHSVESPVKVRATDFSWNPDGNYFATVLEEKGAVSFNQLIQKGENIEITELSTVSVGILPGAGLWTGNGRYFILPDMNDWIEKGTINVISADFKRGEIKKVDEKTLERAPEAIALSGDDQYLIVSCMEGTFFPAGHNYHTTYSTLILFKLGENGKLTELDKIKSDEILPQSISFKPGSTQFALSSFQSEKKNMDSFISFWDIRDEKLIRLERKIEVPRGAHTILWIE